MSGQDPFCSQHVVDLQRADQLWACFDVKQHLESKDPALGEDHLKLELVVHDEQVQVPQVAQETVQVQEIVQGHLLASLA